MKKWCGYVGLAFLFMGGQAMAEEWVPIKQDEATVREVDRDSVVRNGAVVTFTARHTFGNVQEYKVGRRGAKYLLFSSRINCADRTVAQLSTEARDENMATISQQRIALPLDTPVSKGSIDEGVLETVCAMKPRP